MEMKLVISENLFTCKRGVPMESIALFYVNGVEQARGESWEFGGGEVDVMSDMAFAIGAPIVYEYQSHAFNLSAEVLHAKAMERLTGVPASHFSKFC